MISVEAVDDEGELVKSRSIIVTAGNSIPDVDIAISGSNSTFYLPGVPFDYDVTVNDHEDSAEGITPANVFVTVDYLDGFDEASLNVGHQQISTEEQGKNLTQALDCRACHKAIEKSVGPSYSAVADKYKNKADMISYLQGKIIGGSTGVWGEVAMPGHPDLKPQEANQIAIYIKSLLKEKTASLPAKGTFTPETNHGDKTLVMTASYADRGGEGAKSLTGIKKIALKSNVVSFGKNETFENFNEVNFANTDFLIVPREAGWFAIADIDLSGVSAMSVTAGWRDTPKVGMKLEARLNGPEGEVIGTGTMTRPKAGSRGGEIKIKLKKAYNVQADKIYFLYNPSGNEILEEGSFIGLSAVSFSGN
ncbi:UNVERIFIED_CONTAM: hypothetical protein GTU68_048826 [Idotea baltica]|nr:hypothetical protein [Idotea baltica]